MKYRKPGSIDREVSVIGLGTWQFGGEWGYDFSQYEVDAIVDTARETGINLVDTAECYGDHLSEKFLGNSLKKDRESWFLGTKFGHHFHGAFDRTPDFTGLGLIKQVEDSLKSLQTDYIDLLQFHSGDDDDFKTPGLWDAAADLVKQGKVKHLGISVKNSGSMEQINSASAIGAEVIQIVYNRLDQNPEKEALPACLAQNLGVLARVPLASGFLSGKYKPGATFAEGDVRSRHKTEEVNRRLAEVHRILAEEVPSGVDMAVWALAWCLRHPAVTSVIPGCKNPDQLRKNASAAELL